MADMDEAEQMTLGLIVVIQVAALVLKLTGHLQDWSWWWVLAPIWIPVAGIVSVVALMLTVAAIFYLATNKKGDTK